MRNSLRLVAGMLLLGTALAGCVSWGNRSAAKLSNAPEQVAVGHPAPEIEGADLDGTSFKLSDYRGKVVLLDFWANW